MAAELHLRFGKSPKPNPQPDERVEIPVSVHFDGADTETFAFANPLTEAELIDLRWYVERYWQWPVGPDYERARTIEAALPKLGKRLFNAIFDNRDAMRLFERFNLQRGEGGVVTIETTEPHALRLPWELLADEGGYLFSKHPPVSVRRRMRQMRQTPRLAFDLPVRVLMVISRPDGGGFLDPRSSARPMLDSLDALGDRRPGRGRVPAPAHAGRADPTRAPPASAAGARRPL